MSDHADTIRQALNLAATLPLSVPEAHLDNLRRLDVLVGPSSQETSLAEAALDALVVERDQARAERDAAQRVIENARAVAQSFESERDAWAEFARREELARQKAEKERDQARAERDAAQREADWQMGVKLEAQLTCQAITRALDLSFTELGEGWAGACPKIITRIETIVDEAERGFRERDQARAERDQLREHLNAATDIIIHAEKLIPGLTQTYTHIVLGDTAEARERAVAAERALQEARQALAEVHEFQCGCDEPGNSALCVAKPEGTFRVLASVSLPQHTTDSREQKQEATETVARAEVSEP